MHESDYPTVESSTQPLALPIGEAHVWYVITSDCNTPALRNYYRSLLNAEEQERLERFAFDHLKLEYLVTRALCRTVLSAYTNMRPSAWRFSTNAYGRPEVAVQNPAPWLRFNLTNARTLVACVVIREGDVGIDVEEDDRRGEAVSIADRYFSPAELAALRALPLERQTSRFFELWTLKESYIKARGLGLSIPLDRFSFLLDEPTIRVAFDSSLNDIASHWQFRLYRPSDRHVMAIGIHRPKELDFCVRIREVVPAPRLTWRDVSCVY